MTLFQFVSKSRVLHLKLLYKRSVYRHLQWGGVIINRPLSIDVIVTVYMCSGKLIRIVSQVTKDDVGSCAGASRDYTVLIDSQMLFALIREKQGISIGQNLVIGYKDAFIQDIILNQPLLIGGAGQQIGDVAPGSAEAQIQVEVNGIPQVLNATITSEVQFTRFLDTMNIPGFGEFTNVLRMVINLEITTDINLLGETNFPIYGSTFFLKEGVGMIAHDQEEDPDDAQVQLMDSATVGGVEITAGS